jgi:biotin transport system substrate-specific component
MSVARRTLTLADLAGNATVLRDAVLVVGASAVTGLLAQAEIRLPFTPVPITLQPFAVFLFGAALGSRRGALAMLLYLLQGVAGLPVFAGGAAGPAHLAGPTGGYLLGFVPSAFVIGWFAERGWDRHPLRAFVAMAAGSVVLFACGLVQLSFFVGRGRVLEAGLYPFVVGDLLKMAAAAGILPGLWKLLARSGLAPRGPASGG